MTRAVLWARRPLRLRPLAPLLPWNICGWQEAAVHSHACSRHEPRGEGCCLRGGHRRRRDRCPSPAPRSHDTSATTLVRGRGRVRRRGRGRVGLGLGLGLGVGVGVRVGVGVGVGLGVGVGPCDKVRLFLGRRRERHRGARGGLASAVYIPSVRLGAPLVVLARQGGWIPPLLRCGCSYGGSGRAAHTAVRACSTACRGR